MDISAIRTNYNDRTNLFLEEDIEVKEPFHLFEKWFSIVRNNPTVVEPNAMCLSTATKSGIPSARFVLCKGYSKEGFRFFTHYTSRKGQELEENPNCALTFYWAFCNRSVRIEGHVEKLPFSAADEYFHSRPYQSQIGALCSNQSKPIVNRNVLANKEQELKGLYGEGQVPRPPQWGGYIVRPHTIEFWQGQTDRIHDRIRFKKGVQADGVLTHEGAEGWVYERLAP
ncbi:pyridoxine/pyridoxamine 5'-phosphate oxidase [Tribolium castaneum]|uniref:pyridoxal 5'-phosphate synthase n=1 Tax=Tribolium castaneum TaxID=7070 RepID=A0A139WC72_TRICA|nr:PREDICTED: pyridoxine-5'-phosphate oxidase-like [Tribolium castaneum]KYB25431.1 Pyridoxine-5'-phosphate oxidase-like Protein [Tribolium castaneum]|eukprot:XP_971715.1 PREDICTED: pyridoxine-5'-phosphate oxidase-like [Tribolium castaneum]